MSSGPSVMTVSRRVGEHQQALRDRLVAEAAALAEEGGYGAVAISAVAERAGVTRPTVYRYFPDKDHLLLAVGATAAVRIAETLGAESAARNSRAGRGVRVGRALVRAVELAMERPNLMAAFYSAIGSPTLVGERVIEQQHIFDAYVDAAVGAETVNAEEKLVLANVYMAVTLNLARDLITYDDAVGTLESAARLVLR